MALELQDSYVVFDDNNFATQKDVINNRHYHEERIEIRGILNYGLVEQYEEVIIDLEANGITTPVIIDSIVAFSENSTSDEIVVSFYKKTAGRIFKVGIQRFSNEQMPVNFPDGIIFPDMALGVKPVQANANINVYVKPVKVLFTAVASANNLDNQPQNS